MKLDLDKAIATIGWVHIIVAIWYYG